MKLMNEISWELTSLVVVLPQCCKFGCIRPLTSFTYVVHTDRNRTCASDSVFPHASQCPPFH